MIFRHRFEVDAPLAAVQNFHRRSGSMAAITPPPVLVQMHSAPEVLGEGDEMAFTLWLGPVPLGWRARIENTGPTGFVDRQVSGPFDRWIHRHSFARLGANRTEVRDEVEVALHKSNPLWKAVGLGMWLTLPVLFRFRQWKTRRILTGTTAAETG